MANPWFLAFHIIGLIVYLGGLLNLSRILGYHAKEERDVRVRLSRMEKRMYFFVNLPGLAIMLVFGLLLLFGVGREGASEGALDYIRPNQQVLVLKSAIDQENPVIYDTAVIEDTFKFSESDSGSYVVEYEARKPNSDNELVPTKRTMTLPGEPALKKVRTSWGAVFHAKLVCMAIILLLDLFVMLQILRMAKDPDWVPHPRRFKILHGLIALLMIVIIVLVKTRVGLGGGA